jgi:hypothetical protein
MHFKLAICSIVKDEREDYLREWIEWHLLSGADFVYLFDNGSKIPLKKLLSDVCNLGVVELPGQALQHYAYNSFIQKFTGIVKWTAFIDADEFIIAGSGNIPSHLMPWLDPCPYGGMALSWCTFGSNGLYENPSTPQIRAFTKRAANNHSMNKYVKTIAQLEMTSHIIDSHYFAHKNNFANVNDKGEPVHGSLSSYPLYRYLYINHYYIRSRKDYLEKIARGCNDNPCTKRGDEFNAFDPYLNDVEDLTAIYLWDNILSKKNYCKFYNEKTYLENNLDVQNAVNNGIHGSGLEHWLIYGKNEGRKCI